MVNNSGISVVICCFNSAARLPTTLKHLAAQQLDAAIEWEIVLVNNRSTDDTAEVAVNEWRSYNLPVPLRIFDQTITGQTFARIMGVEKSRYEYIVYCDDDNWLFPEYLQRAYSLLQKHKDIAACGGCGIPVFEKQEPSWFSNFQGSYAVGPQMSQDGVIPHNTLYGAGFSFKKSAYLKTLEIKTERMLSGRTESKLNSGDDYEMSAKYKMLGFELYYDSNLKFYHFIPAFRTELKYVERLFEGFGAASAVTIFYDYAIRYKKVLKYLVYKQIVKAFCRFSVSHFMYLGTARIVHIAFNRGKLVYLLNNKKLICKFIDSLNNVKEMGIKEIPAVRQEVLGRAG